MVTMLPVCTKGLTPLSLDCDIHIVNRAVTITMAIPNRYVRTFFRNVELMPPA